MPLISRALGVALLACALAAACDDAPAPGSEASAKSAAAKSKPKDALLPANMVAAVSAGKGAAQIGVHFALESPPAVGKPLPVAVAVVPHAPFASVSARFEAPPAMILATGEQLEQQKNVKPENVLSHKLLLQPKQEGVFLVTAAVETESESGTVTRIYFIPVIVHSDAPASPPAPATNPEPTAPAS